ncbi:MAG: molecular chaperone TorD family protein, partial [Thermacetogeniaceae bacterium]
MSKHQRFELLAKALFYPTQELMDAIKEGLYSEEFGEAPVPSNLEELEVEYCRLFVGPGRVEVPPYESVYHGHDSTMQQGLVMGPVTLEVKELYYEAGLQLAADFSDMPDHIAVETLFLAYLEAQLE